MDYDFHGILGLRLIDPKPSFAKWISAELKPLATSASSIDPDVSVVRASASVTSDAQFHLGNAGDYQECVYSDSELWVRSDGEFLNIPFEALGKRCEIQYTRGFAARRAWRYVRPILQIGLLEKGSLAVHASSMIYRDKGILFAGWAESGKTETLLGFLMDGASMISDKWTIVSELGDTIHSFPSRITMRDWVPRYLPEILDILTPGQKRRLRIGGAMAAMATRALQSARGIDPVAMASEVLRPALDTGRTVTIDQSQLERLGGGDAKSNSAATEAPFDKLFLLLPSNRRDVRVQPSSGAEVSARLAECASYERRHLFGLYSKFKYAIPNAPPTVLDDVKEREESMLRRILATKEVYQVLAPFPCDPRAMQAAIAPFC
ncbi:MAG: hypothetical protein IIC86_00425 [Chloroflexi bacterium]|nr:hypothetical protein [Chloroflexota bacterium]